MKKSFLLLAALIFSLNLASAVCDLTVTFLNQDPDPAVPGEYVKLVFQVSGVENPECEYVSFKLMQDYPLVFDPNTDPVVVIKGGTFTPRFDSSLTVPYKVRIDANALDGDTPIRVAFSTSKEDFFITKEFNLNVKDVRSDFEVYVKDYIPSTNILTLEILNKGKNDVEALAIQIPRQQNIVVKGAQTNLIGSLDSNDFTTADFEAIPSEGEINLVISYTDLINQRRTINKTIFFDPQLFTERAKDQKTTSGFTYFLVIIFLIAIIYFFYRRHKKKQKKKLLEK